MELRSFLSDHPYAAVLSTLVLFGVVAVIAGSGFLPGTFVDNQGCPWRPVENPETGSNFTSVDEAESYLESQGAALPGNVSLQERDGVVYQRIPGECGSVGGEAQS